MRKKLNSKGFTLIELMIVVAIIGILAAVAIPKFADLVTKSKEAGIKGTLGALRSAISIYYGDTEGVYPANLVVGLGTKYMPAVNQAASLGRYDIPKNNNSNPGHQYGNETGYIDGVGGGGVTDADHALIYFSSGTSAGLIASAGDVFINCKHQDSKGVFWTSY